VKPREKTKLTNY